jgi:hypothetical protein
MTLNSLGITSDVEVRAGCSLSLLWALLLGSFLLLGDVFLLLAGARLLLVASLRISGLLVLLLISLAVLVWRSLSVLALGLWVEVAHLRSLAWNEAVNWRWHAIMVLLIDVLVAHHVWRNALLVAELAIRCEGNWRWTKILVWIKSTKGHDVSNG